MSSQLIRAPKVSFVTVGYSKADFIVAQGSSSSWRLQMQAAHDALAADGGVIFLKDGTYDADGKVTFSRPKVKVIMSSGALIRAHSSAVNLSNATGTPGIIHIYNSSGLQTDVTIEGGTIDCNGIANVDAISIWGGGTDINAVGLERIKIKDLRIINQTNTTTSGLGMVVMQSGDASVNVGQIKDVSFENVRFDTGDAGSVVRWNGDYYNEMTFTRCRFANTTKNTLVQNNTTLMSTTQRVTLDTCKFINTKSNSAGNFADFNDTSRTGGYELRILHCDFDESTQVWSTQNFCLNIHSWKRLTIDDNDFNEVKSCIAIGASNNGNSWKFEGEEQASIINNRFRRCFQIWDNDAMAVAKVNHNLFYECGFGGYGAFAPHFFQEFNDNIIYDCNYYTEDTDILDIFGLTPAGISESEKAAIGLSFRYGPITVKNNQIIDDRVLQDPGTVSTGVSQTAGGALGSRTYYVKVTYANNSGETLPSSAQSITVNANSLLTVTPPEPQGLNSTYRTISGIREVKIYVGTVLGAETLQATIPFPRYFDTGGRKWTEPTTGLVSGAALPVSNTTHALTKYGIYEINTATVGPPPVYENNHFYGIATEIFKQSTASRIQRNNWTNRDLSTTGEQLLESIPYAQGNVTGATTFNVANGEYITATATGNITTTLSSGQYVGQELLLQITQDATGSRTISKPANARLAGGAFSPTATANAVDRWLLRWDGTNWVEISRTLNVS